MTELHLPWEIYPLLFTVAALYSSVGHGGASGYLALFAMFGLATPLVAPIALVLNILVASTSFWRYSAGGFFSWKMLLPFILLSIPAAFIGGAIHISPQTYSVVLGGALILSAARILVIRNHHRAGQSAEYVVSWKWGLPIGALLGLISGMTGIGGGVFLSPILLLAGWADIKRSAALASAFIVLNSISGLVGQLTRVSLDVAALVPLAIAVVLGGALGSYAGATRIQTRWLHILLSVVLLIAGAKLVVQYF